jgi:hypothetical protein
MLRVLSSECDLTCVYPLGPVWIWIGLGMFITGLILLILFIRQEKKAKEKLK